MTTALLDGDVYLFQAALAAETVTDWGDGVWTLEAHEHMAESALAEMIERDLEATKCGDYVVVFRDSDRSKIFRKDMLPSYKASRTKRRKPVLIPYLRKFALQWHECYERETLEGDDVLGILMTHPSIIKGDRVCVSIDKDMKTIPGKHYNAMRPDDGVYEVTPDEAHWWHMMQTLTGDTVDGYKGCPGIGEVSAKRILDGSPVEEWWELIVAAFEKAKLSEEEALVQARCARILQASDYDFENKCGIPWTP